MKMDEQKWTGSARPNDTPMGISAAIQPVVNMKKIGEHDVLLGRGKKFYNHQGNVRFRQLVRDRALAYKQKDKAYRRALARDIMSIVEKNGGKFLGEDSVGCHLRRVSASIVLTKVKQALRDMSSRIPDDLRRTTLAPGGPNACAPTTSLLLSMLNTVGPSEPSSFASNILPSSHDLPAVGLFHPLLVSQPIGQNLEDSLLVQLASLEQSIQQRQQMENTLQLMGRQTSLQMDQHIPECFPGGLALPQQTLLHRLNTPIPNEQLISRLRDHRLDLIRRVSNDLHELASLDPGLLPQGTTTPPSLQDEMQVTRQRLGLTPLPHQLGAAPTTLEHDDPFEIPIPNLTEQRVTPESHLTSSRATRTQPPQGTDNNGSTFSRGLSPIPVEPVALQSELDHAQLTLLDDGVDDAETPLANELHHHDDAFCDLFDDDHNMSNEGLFASACPTTSATGRSIDSL